MIETNDSQTVLRCEHCDAEATIIAGPGDDGWIDDTMSDWDEAHERCGQPAGLTNWQHLVSAGKSQTLIQHGGDLARMMPFPRPVWADPDRDQIGTSLPGSCYRSAIASVPATHARGWLDDDWVTARVDVAAKQYGNGFAMVGLTIAKPATAGADVGLSLTPDEARQLSDVLRAAADLAVST
ncbi:MULTISPECIES: hypothetical protein [Gordonia]|uniref:hypothetical protein n=1 Tax=Gordonia TaxID=2053 RepID=UPI00257FEDED|nr:MULTISPECIES: hypothetical protein [Gordonia]